MTIQAFVKNQELDQVSMDHEIRDWLVTHLAELLDISPDDVDTDITFDRYGLDSSAAIGLTGELEDWLGISIEPTLLYDYPTVEALVWYLAEELVADRFS